MTPLFLDASFLLPLLFEDDANHAAAAALAPRLGGGVTVSAITTEYALVEFLNAMSAPILRRPGIDTATDLRGDPRVRIIQAHSEIFEDGFDLYRSRIDKAWGLTDCISFRVMEREGLAEAMTADHHFVQAGFRALPLEV